MELGFIGLGRMGGAMARRLLDAGHRLTVYDVERSVAETLAVHGATIARDLRSVADAAPIVFASLPSPAIVLQAVTGADGLIAGSRLKIVVDLSTSGPACAVELARLLGDRGIESVEAPVSGGMKGAREGTLSLMAAGPLPAWERTRPLIETLGKAFFLGETPGAGQTMKLVNNLLNACAIAITAEGMTLGIKAGLDPARMIEVLNASTGRNSATQDKWPRAVLPRTFDFGFTSGLCLKDVRLCVESAAASGVELSVGGAVHRLLERTVETLGPGADFTAMTKIVESDSGLDPDRPVQSDT